MPGLCQKGSVGDNMPTYAWACHECELYWEREYKMGKAPEKTKCVECKNKCGRSYDAPHLKFIGAGFYCNDYGKNTWHHKNAQGAVDEFVKGAEEASKKRMKTGFQNYRVYTPDFQRLEEIGQIKKSKGERSDVINRNAARYRQTATQMYEKSGIDPVKQEKTNVDLMTAPDKKGLE